MNRSIRLSEKHGVNPAIDACFYCGEDVGVVLFGKLPGDAEAPRRGCFSREPCRKCKKFMKQGCILIGVDEKKSTDMQNPYRTGCFAVVKDEAISRIFDADNAEATLKMRMAFVEDAAWTVLGLPRGDTP